MATVTSVPADVPSGVADGVRSVRSRVRRGWLVLAVLAGWVVLWFPLRGRHTLALATVKSTPLQERINDFRHWVDLHRYSNPFLTDVVGVIRDAIDKFATFLQSLLSTPSATRPVPLIGWLGVVVLAGFLAYAVANWKMALLTVVGFSCFNLLGLWRESMDTLALLIAAVLISVVIGIPLGVGVGLSPRLRRAVTPVLDFMQTMPTFVYLAPLALFFSIGAASGVIATIIYALPPVIRITAFGIGEVPGETLEAGESLGATGWQSLRKVRLPLARRMILVGVNQTTMCALSMVTIAALINAPGLGDSTVVALRHDDVGEGFRAGLAIVIMAIVLDRVTTAAGERARTRLLPEVVRRQRIGLAVGGVVTLVALYLAYTFTWAAYPPLVDSKGGLGQPLVDGANAVDQFIRAHFWQVTTGIRDGFTTGVFNPFENLFTQAPWYLTV
ncbi:MAG TPA: ABC transporter permease subunit, partial [Rugosimonospora sp.]|nr:ABC transporter permease subunit [Rugosimonospora sp.]